MKKRGIEMQLVILILASLAILVGIIFIFVLQGNFPGLTGGAFQP